jgi:hypothetical protein
MYTAVNEFPVSFGFLNPSEEMLLRKAAFFAKCLTLAVRVGASPIGTVQSLHIAGRAISFKGDLTVDRGGAANVHVEYDVLPHADFGNGEELLLGYGDCDIPHHNAAHHIIGRTHLRGHAQMWLEGSCG